MTHQREPNFFKRPSGGRTPGGVRRDPPSPNWSSGDSSDVFSSPCGGRRMLQAVETQLRGIREQGRLPRGPQGLGHRETVLEAREELQEQTYSVGRRRDCSRRITGATRAPVPADLAERRLQGRQSSSRFPRGHKSSVMLLKSPEELPCTFQCSNTPIKLGLGKVSPQTLAWIRKS